MAIIKMYKGKRTCSCDTDPMYGQIEKFEKLGWSKTPTNEKAPKIEIKVAKPAEEKVEIVNESENVDEETDPRYGQVEEVPKKTAPIKTAPKKLKLKPKKK